VGERRSRPTVTPFHYGGRRAMSARGGTTPRALRARLFQGRARDDRSRPYVRARGHHSPRVRARLFQGRVRARGHHSPRVRARLFQGRARDGLSRPDVRTRRLRTPRSGRPEPPHCGSLERVSPQCLVHESRARVRLEGERLSTLVGEIPCAARAAVRARRDPGEIPRAATLARRDRRRICLRPRRPIARASRLSGEIPRAARALGRDRRPRRPPGGIP